MFIAPSPDGLGFNKHGFNKIMFRGRLKNDMTNLPAKQSFVYENQLGRIGEGG